MTDPGLPSAGDRGGEGRARLAAALRHAREAAGLTGVEAGQRSGISQSQIARVESGSRLPTAEDVDALARTYGLGAAGRRELVALTTRLREEQSARVVLTRGIYDSRRRFRQLEQTATEIRGYQAQLVIGLLQTPAYQRAVFSSPSVEQLDADDVAEAAAEQAERRETLLDDTSKTFTLVMTEGALRWPLGGPSLMAQQLDHLAEQVTARPHVRIGVIPYTVPVRFTAHGSFWLYDRTAATVSLEIGLLVPTGRADIAAYLDRFTAIERAAAFGDEARLHFERIADDYRGLL